MVIFRDPVSGLQVFGYGIALSGLIYYKLGAEKLKEYFGQGGRSWAEYRATHPAMSKLIIFAVAVCVLFIVLGGLFPYVPSEARASVKNSLPDYFSKAQGSTGA